MRDINQIRESIKSNDWLKNPFQLLADISRICSSNVEIGRELVIRILEEQESLNPEYQEIIDDLAMQVGLYPYVSGLEELSLRNALMHAAH